MTDIPAMLLWTDAYMADTSHLTTVEHGAYLLLLMAMWRAGGSLPNDDVRLARIARLPLDKWRKVAPTIMEFMTVEGQAVTQKRLKLEFEIASGKAEKLASAGRAGGRAKALKHIRRKPSDASETPQAIGCQEANTSLANQTPETSNQLPVKNSSSTVRDALEIECRQICGTEPVIVDANFKPIAELLSEDGITPDDIRAGMRAAMAEHSFRPRSWSQLSGWVRRAAKDRLATQEKPQSARAGPNGKPDMYAALEESKRILAARQAAREGQTAK